MEALPGSSPRRLRVCEKCPRSWVSRQSCLMLTPGRTRVRSRIQHVLIVTKARDNRLIKLTRELALYLMQKKPAYDGPSRNGDRDRGMIVYVDAQLEQSKRFDAAGMEKEYPDLFKPVHSRRASSGGSMSSYPSSSSVSELSKKRDEMSGLGQLRYWTAEMCSTNSSLFDFVVTVSASVQHC